MKGNSNLLHLLSEIGICFTDEEYSNLRSGEKLTLTHKNEGKNESVSETLVMNLLSDEAKYHFILNKVNNKKTNNDITEKTYIKCFLNHNGDIKVKFERPLSFILDALDKLLHQQPDSLSEDMIEKINTIVNVSSKKNVLDVVQNLGYEKEIEGKKCTFKVTDLLDILDWDTEKLLKFCNDSDKEYYLGYPKEYVFYALDCLLNESNILTDYFSSDWYERFDEIKNMQYIDYEVVNDYLKTENNNIDKFQPNEELIKMVYDGMPFEYNLLEKAIYIYFKLCDSLTYSQSYLASNLTQDDNGHSNIKRLEKIVPDNNQIVCWEFNTLYAYFLNQLGLHFKTRTKDPEQYGKSHEYLVFRYGKMKVKADAVAGNLYGQCDINKIKYEENPRKFFCLNKNNKTKEEFKTILENVYHQYQKNTERKRKSEIYTKALKDVIMEYQNNSKEKRNHSFLTKLTAWYEFFKNVLNCDGVDALGALNQTYKTIFDQNDRDKNITFESFIEYKEGQKINCFVIAIALENYNTNQENIVYLKYDGYNPMIKVSKEKLQQQFEHHELEIQPRGYGIVGIHDDWEENNVGKFKKN